MWGEILLAVAWSPLKLSNNAQTQCWPLHRSQGLHPKLNLLRSVPPKKCDFVNPCARKCMVSSPRQGFVWELRAQVSGYRAVQLPTPKLTPLSCHLCSPPAAPVLLGVPGTLAQPLVWLSGLNESGWMFAGVVTPFFFLCQPPTGPLLRG